MGKQFTSLSPQHKAFINEQKMFFVATAAESGKVNLSPKGGESLVVVDDTTIAWLNLTGSGNETAAHIMQCNRMTIMFCAFEGAPIILRTYGSAEVVHKRDENWAKYASLFPEYTGSRQIFIQSIEMVQSSCGMSVPLYDFVDQRDDLNKWAEKQGEDGIKGYWEKKNRSSLDGFDTHLFADS